MEEGNVILLVLDEDEKVIVTNLYDYNEEEGGDYFFDDEFPVSLEDAKSYGNGNKKWNKTLDMFSEYELFEVESDWGECALIYVGDKKVN